MAVVIGLTGGIASGKSITLNFFKDLGAYVIDYDILSREVIRPCSKAWWEIVDFFGKDILRRDLEIDRKRLRSIVLNDFEKRETLEKIIHPKARKEKIKRIEAIKRIEPDAVIVIDIPLLIEKGNPEEFDEIIVVYASNKVQIRRIKERWGITDEESDKILKMQIPLHEKLKFADFVINNEDTKEKTREQVRKIFNKIRSFYKKRC